VRESRAFAKKIGRREFQDGGRILSCGLWARRMRGIERLSTKNGAVKELKAGESGEREVG